MDIPQESGSLVVDGFIEQGTPANIILTLNSPYFTDLDSAAIADLIIRNASVFLSDGEVEEPMTLFRRDQYFPPFVYKTTSMKGEIGKTYSLRVQFDGETYTSTSTLQEQDAMLDIVFEEKEPGDSLGFVKVVLPPVAPDVYYRFYTQRLGIDSNFVPTLNYGAVSGVRLSSTHNNTITLHKGITDYYNPFGDIYFKKGTIVRVKMCTMDWASYEVWLSIQDELVNYANPFAESAGNVKTNIENGLGVFSAFGAVTMDLPIPK